jgi:hypothetical protein
MSIAAQQAEGVEEGKRQREARIRAIVVRAKEEGTLGPGSVWNDADPEDDGEWAELAVRVNHAAERAARHLMPHD